MRLFLRIAGGLLGAAAACVAVLTPIFFYVNVAVEAGWRETHPPSFWGGVGYVLVCFVTIAIFSVAAYAFLRYAFKDPQLN